MTQATQPHPALNHRCPFCHADPAEPCRTRNSGREQAHPHSRRIALTLPAEVRAPAGLANALCCVCGNKRTVSSDYRRHNDPNHNDSPTGRAEGWLHTQSLKCDSCGTRTRHALLCPENAPWRDRDEKRQLVALGDPGGDHWGEEWLREWRREYRQIHPRNPFLRHRYVVDEAKQAWDDGSKKVIALCGEPMDIDFDPYRQDKKGNKETPGELVAEQLSDTEYEDPDTGLWWVDMACVDCCRVSNQKHWAWARKRLEWLLARFATNPEMVPDTDVKRLMKYLEELFDRAEEETR